MTESTLPTDPSTALLQWVRARRGPLLAHVDGARAVVDMAPALPESPGAPVAVCTDRWLDSLPPHTPGTCEPYSIARDGNRRIVHATTEAGRWVYVVDFDHVIDPAFVPGADVAGWTLRWPD